jgi:hypothetical protein
VAGRRRTSAVRPDEDIYTAADRWLSVLAEQDQRATNMIAQLEGMIDKPLPSGKT